MDIPLFGAAKPRKKPSHRLDRLYQITIFPLANALIRVPLKLRVLARTKQTLLHRGGRLAI
jgi:hypothetical protein